MDYLRPVLSGGRLLVTAALACLGGHVANLRIEAKRASGQKEVALATAVFYLPQ